MSLNTKLSLRYVYRENCIQLTVKKKKILSWRTVEKLIFLNYQNFRKIPPHHFATSLSLSLLSPPFFYCTKKHLSLSLPSHYLTLITLPLPPPSPSSLSLSSTKPSHLLSPKSRVRVRGRGFCSTRRSLHPAAGSATRQLAIPAAHPRDA